MKYAVEMGLGTMTFSHSMSVTIDGVWICEWIYWPLTHTTRNYQSLERHRQSPQFTKHHSTC
jgi:hypothetical protein